jgi:hypothetical protein
MRELIQWQLLSCHCHNRSSARTHHIIQEATVGITGFCPAYAGIERYGKSCSRIANAVMSLRHHRLGHGVARPIPPLWWCKLTAVIVQHVFRKRSGPAQNSHHEVRVANPQRSKLLVVRIISLLVFASVLELTKLYKHSKNRQVIRFSSEGQL